MNVLMINSTQNELYIELSVNDKVNTIKTNSEKHSETILVEIDKLLREQNVLPTQLDCVAVCVGPGSFTGIRIAISVAKAFACTLNCKLVSFTSFELYSYNKLKNMPIVVKGFSNFCYLDYKTQECIEVEQIKVKIQNAKKIICDKDVAVMLEMNNYISPNMQMWPLVKEKIDATNYVDVSRLDAYYLRLSQAELNKKG